MRFIKTLFEQQPAMQPLPTGEKAVFGHAPAIKAVVFDIYGTLLISASGDVDEADMRTEHLARALQMADIEFLAEEEDEKQILSEMLGFHKQAIQNFQAKLRSQGIEYPEIDILEVCQQVLTYAKNQNWIGNWQAENCQNAMLVFEILSNRVFPMPGMQQVVGTLSQKMPLGIVSNAQFYTPVLVNYFLNQTTSDTLAIEPFESDLVIYSFKELRAKPDTALFEKLVPVLKKKYGLHPNQVLYVGNDMLKDVYAAKRTGFRTALFAGDKRSLRLRKDKAQVKNLKPDFVITDLFQILEIVQAH